jgi:hypothetical protein
MSAIITAILSLAPLIANPTASLDTEDAVLDAQRPAVVVKTQSVPPRRKTAPPRSRQSTRQPDDSQKSPLLKTFWRVMPPPGPYTLDLGVSAGANFLETAYGGLNPNFIFRGQLNYRPNPRRSPLVLHGAIDYSDHKQTAGLLSYTSRYISVVGGGGGALWYGPLRVDLGAEVGALVRSQTQTDGNIEPISTLAVQPVGGLIAGGCLAFAGRVCLSLRGAVRTYGIPNRVDYSVLYGINVLLDARPDYNYY